jgi:hypothetical protein
MKKKTIVYILAHSLLFGLGAEPKWDTLRITWGPNPLSKNYYVHQPLTIDEAKKADFVQISSQCNGGKHLIKEIFL